MFRRLLCALGFHAWRYIPNDHGGRPMNRICANCSLRQGWDYDAARTRGLIIWRDVT